MSIVLKHFEVETVDKLANNKDFKFLVKRVEVDNDTIFTGYSVKGSYLKLFNAKEFIEVFFYSNGATEATRHGTNYKL